MSVLSSYLFCLMKRSGSLKIIKRNMAFVYKINQRTGYYEFLEVDEFYDYCQEIARSAYADMLYDTERNRKYSAALKLAIEQRHRNNEKAIVLDIGTGTGLLSLYAAYHGADEIYACEAFQPMARCAEEVIKYNGFADKITLISKRSNEIKVGLGKDMPYRANILVTEVFDTELIGEGAISTFNHAHSVLLEKHATVIPCSAKIVVQVFESDLINKWKQVNSIHLEPKIKSCAITVPECFRECCGSAVHDIQLSQLPENSFKAITVPETVLSFNFAKGDIMSERKTCYPMKSLIDGVADGVFMWWEIVMWDQADLSPSERADMIINCAPKWARTENNIPWRDHWMQAIYYLLNNERLEKNEEFYLTVNHDEYSWQFEISKNSCLNLDWKKFCQCGMHSISRSQIGMLNDPRRWSQYKQILPYLIDEKSVCICTCACSLLGIYAALLGSKLVYQFTGNMIHYDGFKEIAKVNNVAGKIKYFSNPDEIIDAVDPIDGRITVVINDAYLDMSSLSTDNILSRLLRNKLDKVIADDAVIFPFKALLYVLPVCFDDLWKIRYPVKNADWVKLEPFDNIIQSAIKNCDEKLDAQPLWEYPCTALSSPKECMSFTLEKSSSEYNEYSGDIPFETSGNCNGVVIWIDWMLHSNGVTISTGPVEPVIVGKYVKWDTYSKQGVYFIIPQTAVSPDSFLKYKISVSSSETEHLDYEFSISK